MFRTRGSARRGLFFRTAVSTQYGHGPTLKSGVAGGFCSRAVECEGPFFSHAPVPRNCRVSLILTVPYTGGAQAEEVGSRRSAQDIYKIEKFADIAVAFVDTVAVAVAVSFAIAAASAVSVAVVAAAAAAAVAAAATAAAAAVVVVVVIVVVIVVVAVVLSVLVAPLSFFVQPLSICKSKG